MDLLAQMVDIKDPRKKKGNIKYPIEEILFVCLCGLMSRCEDWEDIYEWGSTRLDWLRKHFLFENGICSTDTFSRVFSMIPPSNFKKIFDLWLCAL